MSMEGVSAAADNWYYESQGSRVGPRTWAEMVALVDSGKVTYGTPVWAQGMADWVRAENTRLRQQLEMRAPPPLGGAHVNNGIVWTLAFAPILGLVLEYFVAGMFERNAYAADYAVGGGKYWFVTVALNIVLSLFDEHALKKAGHDTSKFGRMVVLVPVYLYQRAQALGQAPAYFFVWLAMFVLMLLA